MLFTLLLRDELLQNSNVGHGKKEVKGFKLYIKKQL